MSRATFEAVVRREAAYAVDDSPPKIHDESVVTNILAAHDNAVAEAVAAVKADIDANWPGASLPRAIAEQTAGYLGGLTACAVVVKQAFARAVLAGDGE